jgi:hypothetical protein
MVFKNFERLTVVIFNFKLFSWLYYVKILTNSKNSSSNPLQMTNDREGNQYTNNDAASGPIQRITVEELQLLYLS